jgi:hypothetical protein
LGAAPPVDQPTDYHPVIAVCCVRILCLCAGIWQPKVRRDDLQCRVVCAFGRHLDRGISKSQDDLGWKPAPSPPERLLHGTSARAGQAGEQIK